MERSRPCRNDVGADTRHRRNSARSCSRLEQRKERKQRRLSSERSEGEEGSELLEKFSRKKHVRIARVVSATVDDREGRNDVRGLLRWSHGKKTTRKLPALGDDAKRKEQSRR